MRDTVDPRTARLQASLCAQSGVISRRQVLEAGCDDNDIERWLRRREWSSVHPGVYVDHTGPRSWIQRAWAALLALEPAVLAGPSALRAHGWSAAHGLPGGLDGSAIHVAVDRDRHVKAPQGVVLVRRSGLDRRAQGYLAPPRLRVEEAVVDIADSAKRPTDAVAILAGACQQGLTTPDRLVETVRSRARLKRRQLLMDVLADAAAGVRSVMERIYARDVERPHGLPSGRRQRRVVTRRGPTYRDVEYMEQRVVVELDGRLVHASVDARWSDLERDVDAAAAGEVSIGLGWCQVVEPCRTAAAMVLLLRSRGWTADPVPCSPGCPVGRAAHTVLQCGGSSAPGADDPPRRDLRAS